jgi:hypothetical protein
MRSLADILDVGPSPADPPEDDEDWALLDELASAVSALAERLKHEPGLSRAAAQLFVKTETKVPGISSTLRDSSKRLTLLSSAISTRELSSAITQGFQFGSGTGVFRFQRRQAGRRIKDALRATGHRTPARVPLLCHAFSNG